MNHLNWLLTELLDSDEILPCDRLQGPLGVEADDVPLGEHADGVVGVEQVEQHVRQELLQHRHRRTSTAHLRDFDGMVITDTFEISIVYIVHLWLAWTTLVDRKRKATLKSSSFSSVQSCCTEDLDKKIYDQIYN